MTGIDVDPLTADDLRAVMDIDALVYTSPWSAVLWKQLLARDTRDVYLVARHDGLVIGHAGMSVIVDEGHVSTVAVHPDHQGLGVGRALMSELCRAARAAGCTALTLEVRPSNRRAQALYRRFGFAPAGVRKNYYADTNEDALIMWAHDIHLDEFAARLQPLEARR